MLPPYSETRAISSSARSRFRSLPERLPLHSLRRRLAQPVCVSRVSRGRHTRPARDTPTPPMQAATTAAASPHSSVHALAVLEAKYESLIRSNSRGCLFLLHELLSPLSPEERVLKTHVTRWADRGGY